MIPHRIRPSQFIYNYGPGAIMETGRGPRMIPSPEIGLFYKNSRYLKALEAKYEITDQRMSRGILRDDAGTDVRIFRLPTEAENKTSTSGFIYRTSEFPKWKLCINTDVHYEKQKSREYVLYRDKCHICHKQSGSAIRFVMACPGGHLDEVQWDRIAHWDEGGAGHNSKTGCRNRDHFMYDRGTGTIRTIKITCPECGHRQKSPQFSQAYGASFTCTGRFPEKEIPDAGPHRPGKCARKMRIIQRQASSLRVAEVVTLLQIRGTTELEKFMYGTHKQLKYFGSVDSRDRFQDFLDRALDNKDIGRSKHGRLSKLEWDEISPTIEKFESYNADDGRGTDYASMIQEEYRVLVEGAKVGIPPKKDTIKSRILFEMLPSPDLPCTAHNMKFRVSPVRRLSTTTVQRGYRREIRDGEKSPDGEDLPSRLVSHDTGLGDSPECRWYPGTELTGEGIFLMLEENNGYFTGLRGESFELWKKRFDNPSQYNKDLFRDSGSDTKDELHPGFVWWHTLSHLLTRVIGEESGYSSAAIRERVFLERRGDRVRGGVLLYSTRAGDAGSLGGLVSLAPHMEHVFDRATEGMYQCSGDPLCSQNHSPDRHNGAACYGCTMNSETSCEHRNMWLDRAILMDNPP